MLLSSFASLVRAYTGTTTSTFTDAKMLILTNPQIESLAGVINEANPEFFGRTLTRNLEAGIRKYSLPSDILSSIDKVELMLDGVEWKDIDPLEISTQEYATDETTIQARFDVRPSRYYIYGQNLCLLSGLPIVDVVGGIKFMCNLYPTALTNFTDVRDLAVAANDTSQGFPRAFHEILARKVSISWKQNQDRPIALTEHELNVEADTLKALKPLRKLVEAQQVEERQDNGRDY